VRLTGIVLSVAVAIEAADHDMLQAVGGVIALPFRLSFLRLG